MTECSCNATTGTDFPAQAAKTPALSVDQVEQLVKQVQQGATDVTYLINLLNGHVMDEVGPQSSDMDLRAARDVLLAGFGGLQEIIQQLTAERDEARTRVKEQEVELTTLQAYDERRAQDHREDRAELSAARQALTSLAPQITRAMQVVLALAKETNLPPTNITTRVVPNGHMELACKFGPIKAVINPVVMITTFSANAGVPNISIYLSGEETLSFDDRMKFRGYVGCIQEILPAPMLPTLRHTLQHDVSVFGRESLEGL